MRIGFSYLSRLWDARKIAGARSIRRALDPLDTAASGLWLIATTSTPLTGAPFGDLVKGRLGDPVLRSALANLHSPTAEATLFQPGTRRVTGAHDADSAKRSAASVAMPQSVGASALSSNPVESAPARKPSVDLVRGVSNPAAPARTSETASASIVSSPPAPAWTHAGAAAVSSGPAVITGSRLAAIASVDGASRVGRPPVESSEPTTRRADRGGRPVHAGQALTSRTPAAASAEPGRSEMVTSEPEYVATPQAAPLPTGSGLADLIQLWEAPGAEHTTGPQSPLPGELRRRVGDATPAPTVPGLREIGPTPMPHITATQVDVDPFALPGDTGAVSELEAESLLLELLERALRSEARRHGVALDRGGLA